MAADLIDPWSVEPRSRDPDSFGAAQRKNQAKVSCGYGVYVSTGTLSFQEAHAFFQ